VGRVTESNWLSGEMLMHECGLRLFVPLLSGTGMFE
jgi:hypothetical protein